jgi:hypothetical protein
MSDLMHTLETEGLSLRVFYRRQEYVAILNGANMSPMAGTGSSLKWAVLDVIERAMSDGVPTEIPAEVPTVKITNPEWAWKGSAA